MSDIFGDGPTDMGADPLMSMVLGYVFDTIATVAETPVEDESDDYNRGRKDAGKVVRDFFNEALARADGDDGVPKLGRHPASI
jgi:hypothetical protein